MGNKPKKGTLRFLIIDKFGKTSAQASQIMHLWKMTFNETDFERPTTEHDTKRIERIAIFHEMTKDLRMKGVLLNTLRFGIYASPEKATLDKQLEYTIQNLQIGKEIERRFYTGLIGGSFALTIEPHIPYKKQEGLWMLKLHDVSAQGRSEIAQVGINFHIENNSPVISIGVIQGTKKRKENLDRLQHLVHQPWPVFLLQGVQYCANVAGIKTIRAVPRTKQPFSTKPQFHSGKEYDLYDLNFQKMGFSYPTNGNWYFELSGEKTILREKRQKRFGKIFPNYTIAPIPTQLKKKRMK